MHSYISAYHVSAHAKQPGSNTSPKPIFAPLKAIPRGLWHWLWGFTVREMDLFHRHVKFPEGIDKLGIILAQIT